MVFKMDYEINISRILFEYFNLNKIFFQYFIIS